MTLALKSRRNGTDALTGVPLPDGTAKKHWDHIVPRIWLKPLENVEVHQQQPYRAHRTLPSLHQCTEACLDCLLSHSANRSSVDSPKLMCGTCIC